MDAAELFCNANDGELSFDLDILDLPSKEGAIHVVNRVGVALRVCLTCHAESKEHERERLI